MKKKMESIPSSSLRTIQKLFYLIPKHHTREEVFHNMTMCHPVSGIAHINKYIYILVFWDKNCIFPNKICIYCSILIKYQKSLPVHMEWMLHRMHSIFIIGKSDFHKASFFERPVYIHTFFSCLFIFEYPLCCLIRTIWVHHCHCIFPFYTIRTFVSHTHTTHTHSSHIMIHSTHTTHISHSFHTIHSFHGHGDF